MHEFQMNEVIAFYDCPNNDRKRGEYYFHLDTVYATENFLSIDAGSYYNCGGVHPNSSTNYLNINLHTGNTIDKITDVFNLYDSSFDLKREYKEDSLLVDEPDKIYTKDDFTIEDTIGHCIYRIFRSLYKKEIDIDKIEDQCRYYQYERWNFFNFVFRYDGVYISPEFPHAIQGCSYPEWSVIPYSLLKQYLKKESQFVLK